MFNNLRKAFTLPEILLTLVIIGVLATLSFPILQGSYQRNTAQASFANTYKEINQALFKYSRINGGQGRLATTTLFADDNIAQRVAMAYSNARNVGTDCWNGASIYNNLNGSGLMPNLNDSGLIPNLNDLSCFIDDRGTIYAYEQASSDCTTNLFVCPDGTNNCPSVKNKLKNSCGYVYFDINGVKAPNAFGKDVFGFVVTDVPPSYLYPFGGKATNAKNLGYWNVKNNGSCGNGSSDGRTCSARIIEEGMKITYFK